MNNAIYTIGHGLLPYSVFLSRIKAHGIDCVVDIRRNRETKSFGIYDRDMLSERLQEDGLVFMPFFNEFGFIPATAQNVHGKPVYTKVCRLESFNSGIRRLIEGYNKGYNILLLDSDASVYNTFRHQFIGRSLHEAGINIFHILENGSIYSQDRVDHIVSMRKELSHEKKSQAAEIGITGEELAALYLARNDYSILDHNWNLHKGCELDLVARKDGIIHFIEVKTRTSAERGDPQMAIDRKKMINIFHAINDYIREKRLQDKPYQVDSISIVYHSEDDYTLEMKENINHE